MFRVLGLFLKAALVAFLMSVLLILTVGWVVSLLTDKAQKTPPPKPEAAAEAVKPAQEAAVAPVAPKRSRAAEFVSALEFAENVEVSKRRAVQRYPELGVKDSAVNREFIRRMRLFQNINPGFFEDVTWPEKLADAMAADLSLDPQKPAESARTSP
jgi:hypothetical protein